MERRALKTTLEVSTNIAVLLVAVAVLSTLAINYFLGPSRPSLQPGLEKGKNFGPVPKLDYLSTAQTLLIALNTNCSYCRDSLPFYRKLLAAQHQSNRSLRIVALFPNSPEEVAKYLKDNELTTETLSEVDFGDLRVSATPTMILINKSGEVTEFWVGKLENSEADELVSSLTASQ